MKGEDKHRFSNVCVSSVCSLIHTGSLNMFLLYVVFHSYMLFLCSSSPLSLYFLCLLCSSFTRKEDLPFSFASLYWLLAPLAVTQCLCQSRNMDASLPLLVGSVDYEVHLLFCLIWELPWEASPAFRPVAYQISSRSVHDRASTWAWGFT